MRHPAPRAEAHIQC
uniref:Uncharacterized protein n=1 Tax=Rhizophora mucronata TaxID=61149 RepID=A0A2P2PG14_RHIMU